MSYLVLARKYRPQKFEDIVGQEHVSKTLKNALKYSHIAHSYLFAGPRGVGKTTAARILAKTVNCLCEDTDKKPCLECDICNDEKSLDIIEIDGASNRGIDEIRDLRDNVKFAPTSCKYKIYIIDEVHMLTEAAFNALLKTLEEPPAHVIFIFATTEIHKIPDTILSRCQKFNFKLISLTNIIDRLKFILQQENIKFDDEALSSIARTSSGSMRDSLSLLDQVISYSPEYVSKKETEFILGIINEATIFNILEDIINNNTKNLMLSIDNLIKEGFDINQMMLQLREHYRSLMLLKIDDSLTDILNIIPENIKPYKTQSAKFSLGKLTRDIKLINSAINEIKYSEYPRIICELYTAKLSQPYLSSHELLQKLEGLDIKEALPTTQPAQAATKSEDISENIASKPKILPKKNSNTKQENTETLEPALQKNENKENIPKINDPVEAEQETKMNLELKHEPEIETKTKIEPEIKTELATETEAAINPEPKGKTESNSEKNIDMPSLATQDEKQPKKNDTSTSYDKSDLLQKIAANWNKIIEVISNDKMYVATYLKQCKKRELSGDALVLIFTSKFYSEGVEKNINILQKTIEKIINTNINIFCQVNSDINYTSEPEQKLTPEIEPELKPEKIEEAPIPKDFDNTSNNKDNNKLRYTPDDIIEKEAGIKKVIELFDGELLPPKN